MSLRKSDGLLLPGGPATGMRRHLLLAALYACRLDSKRLGNYLACRRDRRRRTTQPTSLPYVGIVDAVAACPLRCPYCPTGRGRDSGRRQKLVDPELVESLLREVGDYLITINFFNWGEPLLHPELPRLVASAKKHGIFTCVSSNLNVENQAVLQGLVEAGLDHLIISISGVEQETYEQYHRGGKLSRVWRNLEMLVEHRHRRGSRKPLIELKYLEFAHNQGEARPALNLARGRGVDTFFRRRCTTPQENADSPGVPSQDRWGRKSAGRACSQLWDTLVLNADGGIAPCCYLYDRADDFAQYEGHGFAEIWNNQSFVNARRLFNPQEAGRLDPQMALSCLKCSLVHGQGHLRGYLAGNRQARKRHLTGWGQEDNSTAGHSG